HPLDNHPDHYATYCFVTAAIEQLSSEGSDFARKMRVHTYLVHRGDWPVPRGDRPKGFLAPPYALARGYTRWHSLALTPEIADRKRRAIHKYRTQTAVERGFLMSFARSNEIFGSLPERTILRVDPGRILVDGNPEDWSGVPPVVVDPIGDYLVAGMDKGGDVRAIYMCTDDKYLYIRVDCVRRLSRRITYTINMRGIGDHNSNDRYSISLKPPLYCAPTVTDWAYKNNRFELALPLNKLHFDHDIFVQVITKSMRITVDNTGWNGVQFAGTARKPEKGLTENALP
ncbi:MAG: hypothetical protein M1133_02725, partial [Armatimonadetes bacterium]|nr:hypothetical protein [Armatimonadota bacterium]